MGKRDQGLPNILDPHGIARHEATIDWHDPSGRRWRVDMQFADIGGRAECVSMTMRTPMVPDDRDDGRRPINSQAWRGVPVAALIDRGRDEIADDAHRRTRVISRQLARSKQRAREGDYVDLTFSASEAARRTLSAKHDFYRASTVQGRARKLVGKGGKVLSPEDALAEVATIYREAWQGGLNPTKSVAEALSLSRSAAAKRVRRARDAGLLPKTTKGRATAADEED
jgi:hypothetical protein